MPVTAQNLEERISRARQAGATNSQIIESIKRVNPALESQTNELLGKITLRGFARGFGKGAISGITQALGIVERVQKAPGEIALAPFRAAGIVPKRPPTIEERIPEKMKVPKTPAERAGFITERAGELLLPAGLTVKGIAGVARAAKLAKEAPSILKLVSPILKPKQEIKAIKRGAAVIKGRMREATVEPSARLKTVAQTAQGIVSPQKTFIENANEIKIVIGREAENARAILKEKDVTFPVKELSAALNRIKPGIMIKADATLSRTYDLLRQRIVDLAQKRPKKISELLEVRKEFDNIAEREIPNLWTTETNRPLIQGIRDLRKVLNEFITKKAGPDIGSAFKESLRKQSLLYDAFDNIAPKAAEELGTTNIGRFLIKHPILGAIIKKEAIVPAIGVAAAVPVIRKIIGK